MLLLGLADRHLRLGRGYGLQQTNGGRFFGLDSRFPLAAPIVGGFVLLEIEPQGEGESLTLDWAS